MGDDVSFQSVYRVDSTQYGGFVPAATRNGNFYERAHHVIVRGMGGWRCSTSASQVSDQLGKAGRMVLPGR